MKRHLGKFGPTLVAGLVLAAAGSLLNGQITNRIVANVNHSFMIGDKMLPAGTYTFRMEPSSELALMTVFYPDNKTTFQFPVRQAKANRIPAHSQLVFRRYGGTEVLCKIFEKGSDFGSELTGANKEEARLVKQGPPVEHSEDQR